MANLCRECGETDPGAFRKGKALCNTCDSVASRLRYIKRRDSDPIGEWMNQALSQARKRANKRGLVFSLNRKWLRSRYTGVCEATGVQMVPGGGPYAPSLDRINSTKGYTPDNTRLVCWGFNVLRGNRDDDPAVFEFMRAAAPVGAAAT